MFIKTVLNASRYLNCNALFVYVSRICHSWHRKFCCGTVFLEFVIYIQIHKISGHRLLIFDSKRTNSCQNSYLSKQHF